MVITDVNQVTYNGDGITTAFPFTFKIIDASNIKLILIAENGLQTEITSDYYVDVENQTVYYPGYAPGSEPPEADQPAKVQVGEKLEIYRWIPINQLADLGEKWPFAVIEAGLDKLTMLLQDIYGWVGRNLINKVTGGTAWDADNLPISNVGGPTSVNDAATKDYVDKILSGIIESGDGRVIPYDTVAQMRTGSLEAGQIAFTLGYHDVNDGGAGVYNIRTATLSDVDDGGSIVILDNGNVAELITDGTVCPEQFGAYGDGVHDDTNAIKKAMASTYFVRGEKTYKLTETISITKDAYLNNIVYAGSSTTFAFSIVKESADFNQFTLEVRNLTSDGGGIALINNSNSELHHITIKTNNIVCSNDGIKYEAQKGGIQYCDVYLNGRLMSSNGKSLHLKVAHNDSNSVWVGEIKVFGGEIRANGANAWGVYCDGYSASVQKGVTALRLIGCSLEQCVNGIYAKETSCLTLVASRAEVIRKTSWNPDAKGICLVGRCNYIDIRGYSILVEDIDISGINKDYSLTPDIKFERVGRNGYYNIGSAYIGADYRLKIIPIARGTSTSQIYGTAENPAKISDIDTTLYPRFIKIFGKSHIEIDDTYDFFGSCNLIIHSAGASVGNPISLYYTPANGGTVGLIGTITDNAWYKIENVYSTLDSPATNQWIITKLLDDV